jgi:hypothetical protein
MPRKPAQKPKQTASFAEIVHNSPQLTTNPYQNGHFRTKTRQNPEIVHNCPQMPMKPRERGGIPEREFRSFPRRIRRFPAEESEEFANKTSPSLRFSGVTF